LDKLESHGGWLLTHTHPSYPKALLQLHNAPVLLEVVGTLTDADHYAISIVGSRHCSFYGVETTKRLSFRLAAAGLTIVSGLARGIDTAAHQAAIAAKGRTIAVIGSGIGQLYPPENQVLAQRITQQGAILSEFPFDSPPNPQTFPYRNRIVAGWSMDLLVVEAGERSGALITANLATDQGRQVYAVPGPIDRDSSAGANRLIQRGAKLVTCAEDILDELQELFRHSGQGSNGHNSPALPLPPEETLLLEALATGERSLEELISNSGLSPAQTVASLLSLELKQRVKPMPGQWFRRT
jgi:DNA processing protein